MKCGLLVQPLALRPDPGSTVLSERLKHLFGEIFEASWRGHSHLSFTILAAQFSLVYVTPFSENPWSP